MAREICNEIAGLISDMIDDKHQRVEVVDVVIRVRVVLDDDLSIDGAICLSSEDVSVTELPPLSRKVKQLLKEGTEAVTTGFRRRLKKEDKPKLTALHIRKYIEDMYESNIRVLYVEFNSFAAPCGAKISILPSKCAPRGLSCESMIYPDLHVAYRWAFPDERINDDVDWKDLVHCVDKIVYRNEME